MFRTVFPSIIRSSKTAHTATGVCQTDAATCCYRERDGSCISFPLAAGRLRLKCDGTRAEARFRLSAKRTSPFKSAGVSVQSTTGSRGVRISGSNAGYNMFRCSVRVLATHSIRHFPLYFPSRASPCAITFQLDSNSICLTCACCCMCSPELLMMDGKTVRNRYSVMQE
jgi:hypothetical protein